LQNKARKEVWGGRAQAIRIAEKEDERKTLERQRVPNSGGERNKPSFWTSVEREIGD
jgi:hypothetical protein